MTDRLSRRSVLAGLGVAGSAAAVGLSGPAAGAPVKRGTRQPFPSPPIRASAGALMAADVTTTGLTYRLLDMTTCHPTGEGQFRQVSPSGVGLVPVVGAPLIASVDPPVGAVLREVTVWYLPGADTAGL